MRTKFKFSFSATVAARTGHITIAGQTISVTQASQELPAVVSYRVLWGSESYALTGSKRTRLPWEITGISVLFSKPILAGDASSLLGLVATGLTGLGTNTLTWNFSPISNGSFNLSLAESGPDALKDINGNPLTGDTNQSFSILFADYNGDGAVNASETPWASRP